ncbi:MAG TPA: anti-sigma factor [Solirubrobacterales bacterium]|nr:anti-sigma factor [Solirubrobacterales bacterium]
MSTSDHTRWSEDLAAYMLGALEADEAAELERHLEGCERCREEMRWLEPAVHSLPEAVERAEPPKRLRQTLMAEVRADARAERSDARPSRWRSLWATRRLRVATGFALVVLVAAVAVGYEVGNDGSGGEAGSTVVSRQPGGITVKMVSEGEGGKLHLSGVDQLPPDKVLEAWVERDGEVEAVPALFVPDRHGQAETTIEDMTGVETVMVTKEPSGGSEAPTGTPIVTMSVPQ